MSDQGGLQGCIPEPNTPKEADKGGSWVDEGPVLGLPQLYYIDVCSLTHFYDNACLLRINGVEYNK